MRWKLKIEYKNKAIEKVCTMASKAEKEYGKRMAELIQLRIDQITAAQSVEELVQYRIGRCHALHNNRDGQYAMDLVHPQRLVFRKMGDIIQIALIEEIIDYH